MREVCRGIGGGGIVTSASALPGSPHRHLIANMSRSMTTIVASIVLVTGLLGLVWTLQRRLIYFPFGDVPALESAGLEKVEAVTFPTADGLTLAGWFFPSPRSPARFTVLVCNGNAGNRAYRAPLAMALQRRGLAVLLFDYRGFGGNSGTPTETGLLADGRAAVSYLLHRPDVDRRRFVLFGESLGSAVAIMLAAERPPAALILRSPFVSMTELGRFHYPFLPVRWLLRDRFAAIEHIGLVRSPLLVIAGARDRIVPPGQSRRLYDAASTAKTLVMVPDADHNDEALLAGDELIQAVMRFLEQIDDAGL